MTTTMLTRLSQMASNNPNKARAFISNNGGMEDNDDDFSPNPTPVDQLMDPAAPHNQTPANPGAAVNPEDYRFSVGKLPAWAKKQVEGQVGDKQNGQNKGVDFPKGLCWFTNFWWLLSICKLVNSNLG